MLFGSAVAGPAAAPGVKATLNGAELEFDGDTGALLRLAYPGVGNLLHATPARASLIDLAYPHPKFEVLRLASRYSRGAKITASSEAVVVCWDRLGMSRTNFPVEGSVSAAVTITAAPDGRSLIFTGSVHNQSSNAVRQVLFPDLMGLVPGLKSPTSNFNVTLGCALTVFVYYQFHGFKEQGILGYLKHFLAPAGAPIWKLSPPDKRKLCCNDKDSGSQV